MSRPFGSKNKVTEKQQRRFMTLSQQLIHAEEMLKAKDGEIASLRLALEAVSTVAQRHEVNR